MAKSYHSAALPMHAAAMARLDMLRAFAASPVLVIDIRLSVTSSLVVRGPQHRVRIVPLPVERVTRDEDVAVLRVVAPRAPASSDVPVHLICVMQAMPALVDNGFA